LLDVARRARSKAERQKSFRYQGLEFNKKKILEKLNEKNITYKETWKV
jgi:hypothetical protein